jgi:ankyrin repeat protein
MTEKSRHCGNIDDVIELYHSMGRIKTG